MGNYNDASFPPGRAWDRRLTEIACRGLAPAELLHENAWFSVWCRGGYYTAEYRHPQVIVLPVVEDRAIVMVRVKRPILDDTTLELPAGGSEPGETPEDCAARELAEEAGIAVSAGRMVPMPPLAMSPNRMPKLCYVFRVDLAKDEYDRRTEHDAEVEKVELVQFDEAVRLIATGGIYVSVPVAVIGTHLLLRNHPI
jgi:8-oxo-dGTP pyrophosphatase MutT (NUDIX family)